MGDADIRNGALRQAVAAYVQGALEVIRNRFHTGSAPGFTQRLRLADISTGSFSYVLEEGVDWDSVVEDSLPAIRSTKQFVDAREELLRDPAASRILGQHLGIRQWTSHLVTSEGSLEAFLRTILGRSDSAESEEEVDRETYSAFESFFYDSDLHIRAWSPLLGFTVEGPDLELGDGLRIRQLTLEERERLLFRIAIPDSTSPATWDERYAIELLWKEPRVVGPRASATDDRAALPNPRIPIEQSLTALRLYKGGAVAHQRLVVDWASWTPFGTEILQWTIPTRSPLGSSYHLSAEEASDFAPFWHWYKSASEIRRRRIDTATRRFNTLYDRMRPDDRLVDLAIVIEALLLDGGVRQELSYRAALRGAFLLGTDPSSRKAVFRRLRDAYSARSEIVHGDDPEAVLGRLGHPEGAGAFIEELEDDLRAAIVATLRSLAYCTEQEHFQRLDDRILGGEGPAGS